MYKISEILELRVICIVNRKLSLYMYIYDKLWIMIMIGLKLFVVFSSSSVRLR